ncbi:alginate lyase family protein [Streptomyces sp. NPDC091217]|uniref:alginate lyase family protein n=1 Tax=Streptomyces sp. NPDC091217 TaxID=3365975 RepID=UPI00380BDB3E
MSQHHSNQRVNRRDLFKLAGAAGIGTLALGASVATPAAAAGNGLAHPGMLHGQADLERMAAKVRAGAQPYLAGWNRLVANSHSQSGWKASPPAVVYRGEGYSENYGTLYNDIHAAYQNALRWRISGQQAHGDTARDILNAWSATLTKVDGNADRFIAAGVYGYQFANAAELMRGYPGFDLERFKTMMLRVFYPMCDSFLRKHNDALVTNYWASWDLLSMCGVLAIGILCDDRAKVEQAAEYFKHGAGNGSIEHAIPYLQPGGLAQFQESGRDQGHTTLSVGLMGALCEMAWNQGIDLYGYDDNRFLKGVEYVAKYNLGKNVPFTRFTWNYGQPGVWSGSKTFTTVSADSRGVERPVWAMIVNHYVNRRRLAAPYCTAMAERLAPEGGGGDYGPNSGGYDQLGFGTLAFTRDKAEAPTAPTPAASTGAHSADPVGDPSPAGGRGRDLAVTGASDLLPFTGLGALAVGGGLLALKIRSRRKGAHRA